MKVEALRSVVLPLFLQALKTHDKDSAFLFEFKGGKLFLLSNNRNAEQYIELKTNFVEATDGETLAVNGSSFVDLIKQFPEEEIEIVSSSKKMLIVKSKNKKSRFALPIESSHNITRFKIMEDPICTIACNGSVLSDAFAKTAFSASDDMASAPLTAVRLYISGSKMIAQSTDNYRISVYETDIDNLGQTAELLIPKNTAESLSVLLNKISDVIIYCYSKYVKFCWDNTIFISFLENGIGKPFPDVNKFIECPENAKITISRSDLLRAIKLASLFSKDSYVNLEVTDEGLNVSTYDKNRGASQEVIVADNIFGSANTAVSCKHILKIVETISSPWITISFVEISFARGLYSAIIIDEGVYKHLICPIIPNDNEDEQNES